MLDTPIRDREARQETVPGWGRRWLAAARTSGRVGKISRGRAGAKAGRVLDLTFAPGRVIASVARDDAPSCEVRFGVDIFDHLQWRRVLAALRDNPLFAARLLAGEAPPAIDEVFVAAGLSLLPSHDLEVHFTCGSDEAVCEHVAAACHAIAEHLADDPLALFTLRGRTRPQLLGALRPGGSAPPVETALPLDPRQFYGGPVLDHFAIDRPSSPLAVGVLARLGSPSADCSAEAFLAALAPAYAAVAARAGRIVGEQGSA